MTSHAHITSAATKVSSRWTNAQKVRFHAFNPNGVVNTKLLLNAEISALVNAKVLPIGWAVAYGSFDNNLNDVLYELLEKSKVGSIELGVVVKMINDRNIYIRGLIDAKVAK